MGNYSGSRKANLTSKEYLELLDDKLDIPQGTLYNLCVAAKKSKVEVKEGITVTFRGATMRQIRIAPHKFVRVHREVFMIEFRIIRAGKQYDRVVQVQLEL